MAFHTIILMLLLVQQLLLDVSRQLWMLSCLQQLGIGLLRLGLLAIRWLPLALRLLRLIPLRRIWTLILWLAWLRNSWCRSPLGSLGVGLGLLTRLRTGLLLARLLLLRLGLLALLLRLALRLGLGLRCLALRTLGNPLISHGLCQLRLLRLLKIMNLLGGHLPGITRLITLVHVVVRLLLGLVLHG